MISRRNMISWLRRLLVPTAPVRRRGQAIRPALEILEHRLAPATFSVNTTADIFSPAAGVVTLRSAIESCNASSGDNIIYLTVPGTYSITIPAANADDNSTGSFNIQANFNGGSLTIENTSGGAVTVDGNQLDRVFSIDSLGWQPNFTVTMTGFTISGGLVSGFGAGSGGGAIYNPQGALLDLSHMVLTNNTAVTGGAILTSGTTTLLDDVLTSNHAPSGNGGAIEAVNADIATVTITDTTIADNTAAANGGGVDSPGVTLVIAGSTFDSNVANGAGGGAGGGAVSIGTGTVTITDSTMFGNSAPQGEGGAINSNYAADFTLYNCTIDENSAGQGGGIAAAGGAVVLGNTIVAGDTASFAPDVEGGIISLGHNLIAITDGSSNWAGSDLTGTAAQPLGANLGPLTNYGGPTATQALLPNSPALNAGDNNLALDTNYQPLTTDQRGTPYARIAAGTVDIGAFEQQQLAQPLVVTTNADTTALVSGQLSLRQAIEIANVSPGADTIAFDPSLTGQTIALNGTALPDITDALTIDGGGITINGNATSGIFTIQGSVNATFTNMTLTNGSAAAGGAIDNLGTLILAGCTLTGNAASAVGGAINNQGTLTVTNCTLSDNNAQQQGGAIANTGTLTIVNSTIVYNQDNLANGAAGGGIYSASGSLTLNNTIVAGNTTSSGPALTRDIDVSGGTMAGSYNLIGDPTSAGGLSAANHNILGDGNGHSESAGLVVTGTSPANNGGPTPTFALAANSPAIDAGSNALAVDANSQLLTADQRGSGFTRVVHFTVDIGAVETTLPIQPIIDLATADNFYVDSRGLFENDLGGQEKWLRGDANTFGNPWYYILPGGAVYAWNGAAALHGNLLLQAGADAWENPELLVDASSLTAAHAAQVQAADQARAFYRSSAGNFSFNGFGGQEVWIEGLISAKAPADQNNPWYFILPDGSVHEWDGQAGKLTGTLVAGITADPNLWRQPELLYDAYQNAAVTSGGLTAQYHFYFNRSGATRNLYENAHGADEKWLEGDVNSFGNAWYFLLPDGKLYAWNGHTAAAGTLLGQLNADAWNDIEKVVGDFAPALSGPATQQLIALDKANSFFRGSLDGNFSYNFLGQQEKWLDGVTNAFGNDYYYVKADGTLTAWNGLTAGGGTILASNLPAAVYADPLLLADAFANGSVLGSAVNLNPFAPNQGGPGDRLG